MQVNTEQTNTQRMLEHNQKKERSFAGSLQRELVDLVVGKNGKMNIDPRESTILNVFGDNDGLNRLFCLDGIESDVDAQILIKLKFIDKVDCCQISFLPQLASNRENVSSARTVKLFVNRNDIDFSDIDSLPPAIELELPFEEPFTTSLAGSKFARLSSIQILVEDNFDTEFTKIGKISLLGFFTPTYEYK